jgi:uncharacterized coiled-coil protein SlyX
LIRTEQSLQSKTAFSRERLEIGLAKVGDAMKKLTTIKDQLSHLTARVAELKKLKAQLQPEPAAEPPPDPQPSPA